MLLFDNDNVVGIIAPITPEEMSLQPIIHASGAAMWLIDNAKGEMFTDSSGSIWFIRQRTAAELAAYQAAQDERARKDAYQITTPTLDPARLSTIYQEEELYA